MKVYEFGAENERVFVMFQCAAEPWWVFKASAEQVAKDFHVFLVIADGHDELGTDFVSIEKNVEDAAAYLISHGVKRVDCLYGVSMGGASAIRFLATQKLPVTRAIIDAGITPYPYPRFICRLIAIRDFLMITLGTQCYSLMKLAAPPERWTPEGEDPEAHYRRIFEFERHHYSARTRYNVFWSTNNYSMPDPVPVVDTEIEYWYGELEKRARRRDVAYACRAFPQTVVKEFPGLEHAELVLMHPKRFYREVMRFMEK